MNSRFALLSGTALLALAGLALPHAASAQSLELLVTESGGPTIPITDNGALDVDPTIGVISTNVTLLNLTLVNYQFTGLQANQTTNALLQNGQLSLLLGGTGSITVEALADTFLNPTSNPKNMTTAASDNFTNATAGDSRTFQSFFNPSNTLGNHEIPSPLLAFIPAVGNSSTSNPGVLTPLGVQPTPYSLTNTTVFTLHGSDTFFGSTTITSPTATTVPEPGTMALLAGLGVSGLLAARRTRRRNR